MKLNGFVGKGTGKLGASVFAISGGEQIVRQYNPRVSNPNTDAQIEQRAKLKLMSQLAADMATSIAFRKKGLVSARNQFVSANIGKCTFVNEGENKGARIDVNQIDLTGASAAFPEIAEPVIADNVVNVQLASAAPADVKRVVYAAYQWDALHQLVKVDEKIVSEAGEGRTFHTSFPDAEKAMVFYAYGIKDATTKTTTKFEEYLMLDNTDVAAVEILATLSVSDYALTKTSSKSLE